MGRTITPLQLDEHALTIATCTRMKLAAEAGLQSSARKWDS
jgi:hypothetical protein